FLYASQISSAARSPLSTAPFIYPCHFVLVCSPAKYTRPCGSAGRRRAEGEQDGSKNAYAPHAQGSSSQLTLFDATKRASPVTKKSICAASASAPPAASSALVASLADPPASNVTMPAFPLCSSLPSHSAPASRSVASARGLPRLRQEERSKRSSVFVARP